MNYRFQLFTSVQELPENWNPIVAKENILLSKEYFQVLETAKPQNMKCYFGGFFLKEELIGGCLFQYLNFKNHDTQQGDKWRFRIRNFMTKILVKDMLILGNNMLTGQNAFYFNENKISEERIISLLEKAVLEIQKKLNNPSLVIVKDFPKETIINFQRIFKKYFLFSVEPNMILDLNKNWTTIENYQSNLKKKYKSRYNSARKKIIGVEKKELFFKDLQKFSSEIQKLYENVAENATINTFFLSEFHFASLKENLKENFRIIGYFSHGKLIGFYTLILNGESIDTYFLGYDKSLQKEKQLYLNILLDMVEFGISENFSTIIFGRTALEIKSTIGAKPVAIFGLIKHQNYLINLMMGKLFSVIEPKKDWNQRKPFTSI